MFTEYKNSNDKSMERFTEFVNTDFNPIEYLAIDPGKSNGVCGYDAKYYWQFMFIVPAVDMIQFLQIFKKVKVCIVEGFQLYPNKAKDQIYSDMETPRVIGRIETWAELNNVDLVKQQASIKPTGYAWIGEKPLPKSNPNNHAMDAHVHFMYWAVKTSRINPADLLRRRK